MKRFVIITLTGALLLTLLLAAGAAAAGAAPLAPQTVATFSAGADGAFAEGMAAGGDGALYVSLTRWGYYDETTADPNIGEVWRVSPGGEKSLVATMDITPYGMLLGVAIDRYDRVYVALWDMGSGLIGNGVYRVDGDALTQVVALPEGVWPNGLAFHGGRLYITDSAGGAVWRARIGAGIATPTAPWATGSQLKPAGPHGIGANGIAFEGDDAYVGVSDFGRIVSIHLRDDGTAGAVRRVVQATRLRTADGIAFDADGGLWITANAGTTGASPSGGLFRLTPSGSLVTIVDDPGWLNYPTTPVFGSTSRTRSTLYVENGAYYDFEDGTSPDVQALQLGIPGLRLR